MGYSAKMMDDLRESTPSRPARLLHARYDRPRMTDDRPPDEEKKERRSREGAPEPSVKNQESRRSGRSDLHSPYYRRTSAVLLVRHGIVSLLYVRVRGSALSRLRWYLRADRLEPIDNRFCRFLPLVARRLRPRQVQTSGGFRRNSCCVLSAAQRCSVLLSALLGSLIQTTLYLPPITCAPSNPVQSVVFDLLLQTCALP